ncbi:hypothetical protein ANCCAN_23766 [Ancylostoma caninum]|uniref:Uncharacterized protein n=1 Tax=Ancylostoma caninum TaxID=29170 RepID=A0A368FHJ5_ANCCA|nr:hypothetical protein ANCCAN_23766 [Ancylostoma caninum]
MGPHRLGRTNQDADKESRLFVRERFEWSLVDEVATRIFDKYGKPQVDLFASRLNHKLECHFSLFADPGAMRIDGFAHNWSGIYAYAFPPFNLIARTIRKAVKDGAIIILVTPLWQSRSWFPLALEHAKEPPVVLQCSRPILTNAQNCPHPLLLQKNFVLLAWKIYPNVGKREGWANLPSPSCWPVGLQTLDGNMNLP